LTFGGIVMTGVAAADELGIDHHVADPHVGEQPAVLISHLRVELEPDTLAIHELPIDLGGFPAARLLAPGGWWVSGVFMPM
jgi:hypothetical protein